MQTFEEFLNKMMDLKKNYVAKQLPISAPGVFTLIMSGALDSLISDSEISLEKRLQAIELFKKAVQSKAQLPKSKTGTLGMDQIKDEFTRKVWLSATNPMFSFRVCDYYDDALRAIGFSPTGTQHLRYRKERTDHSNPVDIFGTFHSIFLDKTVKLYGSRNVHRQPAIVGIYRGYNTMTWGEGNQFRKVKISDGTSDGEGVVWSIKGTKDSFPLGIDQTLKNCHGKPCLFIGRVSRSKRGFKSFSISSIVPFS